MNGQVRPGTPAVAIKIARLVRERGWSQERFASLTGLNRQTVRHILQRDDAYCLRNATVACCARALGLSVHELHTLPAEQLLLQTCHPTQFDKDTAICRRYEEATQPELMAWIERNPDRAAKLSAEEVDEMLSLQGTGGPLTHAGVEHYVTLLERKRKVIEQVHAIAGTEYLEVLEKLVSLMFEKIQPYRDRTART